MAVRSGIHLLAPDDDTIHNYHLFIIRRRLTGIRASGTSGLIGANSCGVGAGDNCGYWDPPGGVGSPGRIGRSGRERKPPVLAPAKLRLFPPVDATGQLFAALRLGLGGGIGAGIAAGSRVIAGRRGDDRAGCARFLDFPGRLQADVGSSPALWRDRRHKYEA